MVSQMQTIMTIKKLKLVKTNATGDGMYEDLHAMPTASLVY